MNKKSIGPTVRFFEYCKKNNALHRFNKAFEKLPIPRQKIVEGRLNGKTDREIGCMCNLSATRISQIEHKAIRQLKKRFGEQWCVQENMPIDLDGSIGQLEFPTAIFRALSFFVAWRSNGERLWSPTGKITINALLINTREQVSNMRGIGKESLSIIEQTLMEHGLFLKGETSAQVKLRVVVRELYRITSYLSQALRSDNPEQYWDTDNLHALRNAMVKNSILYGEVVSELRKKERDFY
ncbi:MAG: hypothetical protein KAS04_06705 [Candidatus Aenigmarchaeota archaeon]|nr:hypothetical protein [Candidatus Aenigmarchaeota archaeon]